MKYKLEWIKRRMIERNKLERSDAKKRKCIYDGKNEMK